MDKSKDPLDYASPSPKPKPTRIGRIAAASAVLPMIYRLVFGFLHIEPGYQEIYVGGWSFAANWWLESAFYCGPFLAFAGIAVWSFKIHDASLPPVSRLVGFGGLVINVALGAHQLYAIHRVHGWP